MKTCLRTGKSHVPQSTLNPASPKGANGLHRNGIEPDDHAGVPVSAAGKANDGLAAFISTEVTL